MEVTTAKELKNRTGEALSYVARGGKVPITRRGKRVAVLGPACGAEARQAEPLRPPAVAWAAIERRLKATKPAFSTWLEGLGRSRRRS
jgi:prevent-host-death family protein